MQDRRKRTLSGARPATRGWRAAAGALGLAAAFWLAPGGAFGTGQVAAQGGDSYKIQLVNRTCADLKLSWESGLACDSPDAPGCSLTLRSNVSTNLNLNLERRTEQLNLTVEGSCAGGDAGAHVRVAGDDAPGQVARALRAASAPMRIEGSCLLPLTRMFPYAGMNLQETTRVGPGPIVQPAPGSPYASQGSSPGDPFGQMGVWGVPRAGITTTVPEITSPVPVLLRTGPCREGADGIQVCEIACDPQEDKGGLPTVLPGILDNTD